MQLVDALATSCSYLAEISPSWATNAWEFLRRFDREGTGPAQSTNNIQCPNLELVSLWEPRFRPSWPKEDINRVLLCASRAARSMPKLRIMEIWSTGPGYSYLFRYHYDVNRRQSTITWRWARTDGVDEAFCLTSEAVESWSQTASNNTGRELCVELDPLPQYVQESRETRGVHIYRHMLLQRLVYDPVTQEQYEALVLH